MEELKICTEAAKTASQAIDAINKKISNEFAEMKKAVRSLGEYWQGEAAEKAINKFDSLDKSLTEPRTQAWGQYVLYIGTNIGEHYEYVEKKNTEQADKFH